MLGENLLRGFHGSRNGREDPHDIVDEGEVVHGVAVKGLAHLLPCGLQCWHHCEAEEDRRQDVTLHEGSGVVEEEVVETVCAPHEHGDRDPH